MNRRTIIATILILALAGGVAFAMWRNDSDNGDGLTPTSEESQENNNESEGDDRISENQVIGDEDSENNNNESESNSSGQDNNQTQHPPIEVPNILSANQSGDNIRVSAIFNAPSEGICKLTLTKSGYQDISKEANIVVGPSYYACDGFRIPVKDLPTKGEWQVYVVHILNSQEARSEINTIKVE